MRRRDTSNASSFLPLADIFTSAMVCLLILIMLSSRTPYAPEQRHRPQADVVYECLAPETWKGKEPANSPRRALGPTVTRIHPDHGGKPLVAAELAKDIVRFASADRMSVRMQLLTSASDRHCVRSMTEEVSRSNDAFDRAMTGSNIADAQATGRRPLAGAPSKQLILMDVVLTGAPLNAPR